MLFSIFIRGACSRVKPQSRVGIVPILIFANSGGIISRMWFGPSSLIPILVNLYVEACAYKC